MLLHLCSWPEVETYLKTSDAVIMPIGSTEQHGPTGLIGTDAICAETIAKAIGKDRGALVGPTISVGMAQHHMAFAGSMTLRPSTLMLVVRDYVLSLAQHGFRRFFFINGHGGNCATVRAAFSEIHMEVKGTPLEGLSLKLVSWYEDEEVHKLASELFGDREGSHATPSEVALSQYAYPDFIKTGTLIPAVAPDGGFQGAADYRRNFPDGRIGSDPSLAKPELGERLFNVAVRAISKTFAEFAA